VLRATASCCCGWCAVFPSALHSTSLPSSLLLLWLARAGQSDVRSVAAVVIGSEKQKKTAGSRCEGIGWRCRVVEQRANGYAKRRRCWSFWSSGFRCWDKIYAIRRIGDWPGLASGKSLVDARATTRLPTTGTNHTSPGQGLCAGCPLKPGAALGLRWGQAAGGSHPGPEKALLSASITTRVVSGARLPTAEGGLSTNNAELRCGSATCIVIMCPQQDCTANTEDLQH